MVDSPRSGLPATPGRWVPKQLTDGHTTARVDSCTELLQEYQSDPTFLQRVITGDETWVHHYEPDFKRSMEWRHPSLAPIIAKNKKVQSRKVGRKDHGYSVLGFKSHLFGPMKEALRGDRYTTDKEVKTAVKKWLRGQNAEFYEAGIQALLRRWIVVVDRDGDYVEK